MTPIQKHITGFTLIEMAIVVIIIGLIMMPAFQFYEMHIQQQRMEISQDAVSDSSTQIAGYRSQFLSPHYPCPSDQALPPTDPNYGKEFNGGNCSLAALAALTPPNGPLVYAGAPTCTGGGGFCIVPGARDTLFDTETVLPDPVLVGGVPIKDLKTANKSNVPDSTMLDGWGNQLTYAVTQSMADITSVNTQYGAVGGVDENGQPTAGINNDANYAIISHGSNGNGAFSQYGTLVLPCGSLIAAKDNENCNLDGTFVQELGFSKELTSGNYYDDIVYFGKSSSTELWAYITSGSPEIYNLNQGNVGIKTASPQQKLDVTGTIRADNNVKAAVICESSDPTKCFNISAITSTGSTCSNASTVTIGINAGNVDCAAPPYPPLLNVSCGLGWFQGVRADGTAICY